ncbi:MAG: Hint domain-containing protein [Pseudomonadota bacterium]
MAEFLLYTLEASNITVSDGESLSNPDQGSGVHLQDKVITLNSNAWRTVLVEDSNDSNFNDSDNSQTLVNDENYNDTDFAAGRRVEAEYTLEVEDPDGNTYTLIGFNINEPGVTTYTTVEGLAFIGGVGEFPPRDTPLTVIETSEGPGGSSTPYSTYATPPCLTPGTRVRAEGGDVPVEALAVGDLVMTADRGLQTVRWIGTVTLPVGALADRPELWPVRISAGAFGPGRPARDLTVSPQHRIALMDWRCELYFGQRTVLVPARHLVDGIKVRQDQPDAPVTYVHVMFDNHELIDCEGVLTESFQPGPVTLIGMAPGAREELLDLFPELASDPTPFDAARCSLKGHESRLLRPPVDEIPSKLLRH